MCCRRHGARLSGCLRPTLEPGWLPACLPVRQRGLVTVTTYSELRGRNTYPLYKARLSCPPSPFPQKRIPRIYPAMVYCQNDLSLCRRAAFCCMPEITLQQKCSLIPRTMYFCMCPVLNVVLPCFFLIETGKCGLTLSTIELLETWHDT